MDARKQPGTQLQPGLATSVNSVNTTPHFLMDRGVILSAGNECGQKSHETLLKSHFPLHKYHCTCLGRRKLCQTSAGCRHFGNSLQTRFPVPPRALRSVSSQGQEMRPAPAHFSDVSGICRCRAPLGFWPSVMPRERLTITSAIAVRKRKHIVFSDRGFGTRRA